MILFQFQLRYIVRPIYMYTNMYYFGLKISGYFGETTDFTTECADLIFLQLQKRMHVNPKSHNLVTTARDLCDFSNIDLRVSEFAHRHVVPKLGQTTE
jgi:hypothetical protein